MVVIFLFSACRQNARNEKNERYEVIINTIDSLERTGEKEHAKRLNDSAFGSRTHVPPYYKYHYYKQLSRWAFFEGYYNMNGVYLDSMRQVMETDDLYKSYPVEYSNILNGVGDHYFFENNYAKAFDVYFRSREVAMSIPDSCSMSNQSYHLGMITYRQERYNEAIQYFRESYTELGSCTHPAFIFFKRSELINNIGLAFTQLKQYDSAKSYYELALAYNDTHEQQLNLPDVKHYVKKAKGVIFGNLAKIYITAGKTDTAEQLLKQSIAINTVPGYDMADAMTAYIQLAELYYNRQRVSQAMNTLQDLRKILDTLPDYNVMLRMAHLDYLCHRTQGETEQTLKSLDKYFALKDSADKANRSLKQTDYGQLLRNQESQFQIKLLKKNNELNRIYLLAAIAVSLLTSGIILLVYSFYRRSRKNVAALTLLNQQVTDQKQQLERALEQLEQSNNDKDRILQVVAHDLRNPVSGVVSLIYILEGDDLPEGQKKMLTMMRGACESSLRLIGEILQFSGNKRNSRDDKKVTEDMNEIAKQTVGILQFKANDKHQQLALSLHTEPLVFSGFAGKIERVLSNLIANAIKFSPAHSIIHISVTREGNSAAVAIKDNGIGIPAELQSKVFDVFTDAKRPGTEGEKSFGLGLSICRQIVEATGGTIWLESSEGAGSTFFVKLPLQNR